MLRFANNIVLITENEKDLVKIIKNMDGIFIKDLKMNINVQKMSKLVCGK